MIFRSSAMMILTCSSKRVIYRDTGDRRAALVVDDLIGQDEIVVKQYDAQFEDGLPYFGGATLLADGSRALIVDVSTLV